jgi:hypothetical protein
MLRRVSNAVGSALTLHFPWELCAPTRSLAPVQAQSLSKTEKENRMSGHDPDSTEGCGRHAFQLRHLSQLGMCTMPSIVEAQDVPGFMQPRKLSTASNEAVEKRWAPVANHVPDFALAAGLPPSPSPPSYWPIPWGDIAPRPWCLPDGSEFK